MHIASKSSVTSFEGTKSSFNKSSNFSSTMGRYNTIDVIEHYQELLFGLLQKTKIEKQFFKTPE